MIKVKLKLCAGCGLPKHIWKNVGGEKYCKVCYGRSITGVAKKPKPTATRIPAYSSKRAKMTALYSVARVKFLQDHPMCHAHLDAKCSKKSTEVHHKAGRLFGLLLDQRYWLPTCHECHTWIEMHPEQAKEMGLSTDRLNLEKHE
jgi:hypothetical protein